MTGAATALRSYMIPLLPLYSFRYISKLLSAADDDWAVMLRNLRGAQQ